MRGAYGLKVKEFRAAASRGPSIPWAMPAVASLLSRRANQMVAGRRARGQGVLARVAASTSLAQL